LNTRSAYGAHQQTSQKATSRFPLFIAFIERIM
jgi:hypothetical protein